MKARIIKFMSFMPKLFKLNNLEENYGGMKTSLVIAY